MNIMHDLSTIIPLRQVLDHIYFAQTLKINNKVSEKEPTWTPKKRKVPETVSFHHQPMMTKFSDPDGRGDNDDAYGSDDGGAAAAAGLTVAMMMTRCRSLSSIPYPCPYRFSSRLLFCLSSWLRRP